VCTCIGTVSDAHVGAVVSLLLDGQDAVAVDLDQDEPVGVVAAVACSDVIRRMDLRARRVGSMP
jgi:hypothetical protein